MLLDTLGASLLWNMSVGKGFVWAAEGTTTAKDEGKIGTGHGFQSCLIFQLILRYKDIIKMDLDLMVFI